MAEEYDHSSAKEDERNDYWGEDEDCPSEDWRYDVANGDTRLGYWEWVEHQNEQRQNDRFCYGPRQ